MIVPGLMLWVEKELEIFTAAAKRLNYGVKTNDVIATDSDLISVPMPTLTGVTASGISNVTTVSIGLVKNWLGMVNARSWKPGLVSTHSPARRWFIRMSQSLLLNFSANYEGPQTSLKSHKGLRQRGWQHQPGPVTVSPAVVCFRCGPTFCLIQSSISIDSETNQSPPLILGPFHPFDLS